MKTPASEKIIKVMSFTLFALLLAEAYLNHRDEIEESVERLKTVLNKKGDTENAE